MDTASRPALLAVFAVAFLIHFPTIGNALGDEDSFNALLEAYLALTGQGSAWVEGGSWLAHQNLQRLLPALTWTARLWLFDLWMPGWHLPSLLLHGLNSVLVMGLARRLGLKGSATLTAGLLFAVSPTVPHVVAWLGATSDLMCASFMLGALIAFIDRRAALCALCTAGAMLSKETGVLTPALLGWYWLWREREGGLSGGMRRLAPCLAPWLAIAGLRAAQLLFAGGLQDAGLPGRSVAFEASALLVVGPSALAYGLGAALKPLGAPQVIAAATGGLLVAALALRSSRNIAIFGFLAALGLLVPILVLRDFGQPFGLDFVLYSPRYLYLPLALATPGLAALLLQPAAWWGRGLAITLIVAGAAQAGTDTLRTADPDRSTDALQELRTAAQTQPNSRLTVLANRFEPGLFRGLLSRWFAESTGAHVQWIQRGSWRIIEREPGHTGMDFREDYLQVTETPWDPEPGAEVWLLRLWSDGSPFGATRVTLPTRRLRPGRVRTLLLQPAALPNAVAAEVSSRADSGLDFIVTRRPDVPGGYAHRPLVATEAVDLPASAIWGVRVTYSATERLRLKTDRSLKRGYLELHWDADVRPDESFVAIPVIADGERRTVEIPLWLDPVFAASGQIRSFGLHPLDDKGRVTVHALELVQPSSRSR